MNDMNIIIESINTYPGYILYNIKTLSAMGTNAVDSTIPVQLFILSH